MNLILIKHRLPGLIILLPTLLRWVPFTHADTASNDATNGLSFFMTVEFRGPETRAFYRVGLATRDMSAALEQWSKVHRYMAERFIGRVITDDEARKLRGVLSQAALRESPKPSEPRNRFSSGYVLSVSDGGHTSSIGIGFDSKTFDVIQDLKRACSEESGQLLGRIIQQLSDSGLSPNTSSKAPKGSEKGAPKSVSGRERKGGTQ
jgi:hypothetical protein